MESPNPASPPINIIPVPVAIPKTDGNFLYIAVKGSLYSSDSAVFGLNDEETVALSKRFSNSSVAIENGHTIKGPPITVINTLAQLGYKVVCSTGDNSEIVWTLRREI